VRWTREIDPLHRVAIVTLSGELTDDGLFMLYDELQDAPEVGSDFAILVDLRRASGRKLTSDGIGAVARRPLLLSPKARRAVVVSRDLESAMAQLYNRFRAAKGGEVVISPDFAVARRWVEIQEE
jgi:hypothetical protein